MPQTQNHTTAGVLIVKVGHTIQKTVGRKETVPVPKLRNNDGGAAIVKAQHMTPLFVGIRQNRLFTIKRS